VASSREARSRRIGAVGEARVAAELKRIGFPALHNVILRGAGWSVEFDHVVRVPSGIVVLETKTFGGMIEGQLDFPVWTQRTVGGVEVGGLANPVLQNQAHVSALEGFLDDLRVPICGYVVSAGGARFAPEIVDAVVSVRDLRWVLSICFADPSPRVLDAAWRLLEREAVKSPGHRAPHEAYAPPAGRIPGSALGVISRAPVLSGLAEADLSRPDLHGVKRRGISSPAFEEVRRGLDRADLLRDRGCNPLVQRYPVFFGQTRRRCFDRGRQLQGISRFAHCLIS
jgi:hypothetical protein